MINQAKYETLDPSVQTAQNTVSIEASLMQTLSQTQPQARTSAPCHVTATLDGAHGSESFSPPTADCPLLCQR